VPDVEAPRGLVLATGFLDFNAESVAVGHWERHVERGDIPEPPSEVTSSGLRSTVL